MPQFRDAPLGLPSSEPCLVVGVGASAGGLDAFGRLLKAMPVHPDIALVYVQHLDPNHESMLPHLLARDTRMPVEAVRDETPLEGGHVYVIPPNTSLSIEGRVLRLEARAGSPDGAKSIDTFLTSLAADQGELSVGIILSGTGNDGTSGLRALREAGGTTLVQVPETAAYDGMPRSAIEAGLADHVLSPEEMPRQLVELAARLSGEAGSAPAIAITDATVEAICEILRARTRHDFSGYKRTTIARRIARRMEALALPGPEAYLERLEQDSNEAGSLFKEMLIGVTRFFRDPGVFAALAPRVAARLEKGAGAPVRAWVVGCATGEEAYSLAMLITEQVPPDHTPPKVQIFATDLDEQGLQVARRGLYPESISQEVSAERLERFFVHRDDRYQVKPDLRQLCIFSKHNLLHDPPFPELDLVSCRNLLIYLTTMVQTRAIRLFHHALRPGGLLVLGAAETAVGGPNLFEELNRRERIYRRIDMVSQEPLEFPLSGPGRRVAREPHTALAAGEGAAFTRSLERAILDEYVPPGMVVREGGQVLYLFGPTARYLGPSAGAPTASAFGLVHRDLRIELRRALEHAVETHRATSAECQVEFETGHRERVAIFVRPFTEVGPDGYLVVFRGTQAIDTPADPTTPAESVGLDQLREELRNTRQQLLATIDQLESANQELQSTNEELLSLNEELQSANEELQSSKEEVQTINAELESVNRELSGKVNELGIATSDLENLFEGAQLATLFLDSELLIKRFTPAATEVFRLRPGDVGRPVTDITARFTNGDVAAEIKEVLRTLQRHEVTVTRAEDGNRYLMRILPYRTRNNVIDGVVVTFFDVTELKRAQEELQRLNADLERSASSLLAAGQRKDDFLAMLSHELRNPLAAIASNIDLWHTRGITDPVLLRGLDVAHRQVLHMTRLLNDLLDTARILRGTIELKRETLDFKSLITQVTDAYRTRVAVLGQELVLSMPDVPESIGLFGDRDRLEQVLDNLLSNAHKFTPEGGRIRMHAEVVGNEVIVRVADDGIGLTSEFAPHVFEPFAQGRRGGERTRGGLGLGLWLVRHLVELHGGSVNATSQGPGLGSEFTVRLPLAVPPSGRETPSKEDPPPSLVGAGQQRRVVIVDDNVDGAEMLTAVLQAEGHETRTAHDGKSALRLVQSYQPDVVLLDIGLPDMDGYEVARLLRKEQELRHVRLVALTGYAQEGDKRLSREAGFDYHMVKPVDMPVLRDLLRTAGLPKSRT